MSAPPLEPKSAGPWSARAWVRELAVAAFFVGLALWVIRPLPAGLDSQILMGPDPPIYVWTVDWLSGHLLDPGALFEGNIYHPVRHAVLLSDLAFGTALLVAPLRAWVRDPVTLYNLGLVLTLAFGGWSFQRLVQALTGSVAAGLLSGTLAAFGSHQLLHVPQLALVNIAGIALLLLALHRAFAPRRPWVQALGLGAAFAFNTLSSGYFAVAGTLLALVYALCHWRRFRTPGVFWTCLGAALVAAALLAPYVRAFLWLQATEHIERSLHANIAQAFRPLEDLGSQAYLYRGWLGATGQQLFPGFGCLFLAAWACRRRVAGWVFYLGATLVLLGLSLGPELRVGDTTLDLPYAVLFDVPPLNALMHPYSFAAVARLCLCVLAGMGLAVLAGSAARWALPVALVIGLAEVAAPPAAVRAQFAGLPEIYTALERLPPGPVLEIPVDSSDAMICAARSRRPMVNGSSGMAPRDHGALQRWMQREWLKPSRAAGLPVLGGTRTLVHLRAMDVRYVIVPAGREPRWRRLQEAFERSPDFTRLAGQPGLDTLYGWADPEPAGK